MGLLAAIWNLYLGLLALLGNTVLVLVGIGLCGYATAQQLEPLHDAQKDVILFVVGILLVASSTIRRVVWTFSGLGVIWAGLVWLVSTTLTANDHSFEITMPLIAIAAIPPFLITLFLEITRKENPNETDLEISLSEQPDPDS